MERIMIRLRKLNKIKLKQDIVVNYLKAPSKFKMAIIITKNTVKVTRLLTLESFGLNNIYSSIKHQYSYYNVINSGFSNKI